MVLILARFIFKRLVSYLEARNISCAHVTDSYPHYCSNVCGQCNLNNKLMILFSKDVLHFPEVAAKSYSI